MRVLGLNAIFHDPAAALVVDGVPVAATEEERFSRRKHGKRPVPFSAWELPELSAAWCLKAGGLRAEDLDAVTYSYDPALHRPAEDMGLFDPWDHLRLTYAEQVSGFLATSLPGFDPSMLRYVPHHVAHAASAALAAPFAGDCAVLVLDGRGEQHSHLAGVYRGGRLETLAAQGLPHSLGLLYEDATAHLGFLRSSDEFKVMALASYGKPRFADQLRELVHSTGDGGFVSTGVEWAAMAKARQPDEDWTDDHADMAASLQCVLEETLVELATWLRERTDAPSWPSPAASPSTAWPTAASPSGPVRRTSGCSRPRGTPAPRSAAPCRWPRRRRPDLPDADGRTGRGFTDDEIEAALQTARLPYERPADVAEAVAEALADDGVIAWFQGRSEYGPRALGHRSLLAHPGRAENLARLNDVKGREQFRPVAPMVLLERAAEIFSRGPDSRRPYMLFVHEVAPEWRDRIPAVVHVDGTARIQTVDRTTEPCVARDARGVRTPHRPAGRRQHQPEHRRPADGRRHQGRARVLRGDPGRPAGDRAVRRPARLRLWRGDAPRG